MRSGVSALVAETESALAAGKGSSCLDRLDVALEAAGLAPAERGALLQMRARVHREAMGWSDMLADSQAAEEAFAAAGDLVAQAKAVALIALAASQIGDPVLAADHAVRVRAIMARQPLDDARLYNRLGLFCFEMFDYQSGQEWFELGVRAAQSAEDEPSEILLTHNVVETIVTDIRLTDFQAGAAEPDVDSGDAQSRATKLRRLEQLTRWMLRRQLPGQPLLVDGPRLLGLVLCAQGRLDEAVDVLREALPAREATSSSVAAIAFDAAFGWALLCNGEAEEAAERLGMAVAAHGTGTVSAENLLARLDLGEALQALGRHSEALRTSREAVRAMVTWLRNHGRSVVRQVEEQAQARIEADRMRALTDELTSNVELDPLTGAGNRRKLETLATSLARGSSVGVCVLDLDRFKQVNDRFGHAVGDDVLVTVVNVVRATCRDGDEVVRLGGEEFIVLLPGASPEATAAAAERLRLAVERYPWLGIRRELQMTVSIGWAAGAVTELHRTIEAADQALLVAKRLGRNRCVAAHPPLAQATAPA